MSSMAFVGHAPAFRTLAFDGSPEWALERRQRHSWCLTLHVEPSTFK